MTDAILLGFEAVAGSLVNGFLISILLIGLATGVLKLAARRRSINASTRYGVWALTLGAVVLAHILAAGLMRPALDVPESPAAVVAFSSPTDPVLGEASLSASKASRIPSDASDASDSADPGSATPATSAATAPDAPAEPAATARNAPAASAATAPNSQAASAAAGVTGQVSELPAYIPGDTREVELVPDPVSINLSGGLFLLTALLILIWFSGATAGLASVVSAWRRVRELKADARTIDATQWRNLVPANLRRSFTVAESDDVSSPVAAGLLHPIILIPVGLLDRLTTDEFRQVLLHEIAHLERFDDWTILAQRIGEAILWHHPGMWMISRELHESREIACDDWVVGLTRRPEDYVHSIGRMIELNLGTKSLRLAPGLAAEKGDLMGRMRRLLNQKLPDSSGLSGEQVAVAAGLVGLVLVLVAVFVPMMRLAFSFGDGEAMTYIFGGDQAAVVQTQAVSPQAPLPPLAPIPALPELPELPELPPIADFAEAPLSAPIAESPRMREQSPPVPAGAADRYTPVAPFAPREDVVDLSVRSWIRILDSAAGISSNGERSEVLRTALTKMPDDDRVVRAWIGAVNLMSSSGARSELLVQLVGTARLDSDRIDWIGSSAASIPSTGDRERVLRALSDNL